MKKCSKCQELMDEGRFAKDRNRKDGLYVYCKECSRKLNNKSYNKNRSKILERRSGKRLEKSVASKNYRKTLAGRYTDYKHGARQRNLEFSISIENFSMFWQRPCEYCGANIETIGLDRIDSKSGYTQENICSCCETCNRAKLSMSAESWLEYLEQISKYQMGGDKQYILSSPKTKRYKYKHKAKIRGLCFAISSELFDTIISKCCHYCGRQGNIGIDRIDNSIGYVEDNCVPCCKNCNSGKRSDDHEVFIKWINRITQKYGKNVSSEQ